MYSAPAIPTIGPLAEGFIAEMCAKGVTDLNEEALTTVFSGTMTSYTD